MLDKIKKMFAGDDEMKALATRLKEEEDIKKNLNLDTAKSLLEKHPEVVIGGSLALFLYGIRLDRWKTSKSDLDIVVPYYILFDKAEMIAEKTASVGKEFDCLLSIGDVHVDVKIDPRRRYQHIEYEDFIYRVAPLEVIWEAKCRYAVGGNKKHTKDLMETCGIEVEKEIKEEGFNSFITGS